MKATTRAQFEENLALKLADPRFMVYRRRRCFPEPFTRQGARLHLQSGERPRRAGASSGPRQTPSSPHCRSASGSQDAVSTGCRQGRTRVYSVVIAEQSRQPVEGLLPMDSGIRHVRCGRQRRSGQCRRALGHRLAAQMAPEDKGRRGWSHPPRRGALPLTGARAAFSRS